MPTASAPDPAGAPPERRRHFDPAATKTFSALAIPNYRRYVAGQSISLVGTWMQRVAQTWLVLELTHSGTLVGALVAAQTLPILLLGPYGGVVADRVDKRRLMVALQSMMGVLALILGLLTVTHVVTVAEIFVLAGLLGLNTTFENPARQSFVLEMVGPRDLRNAVTLNSVLVNAARIVGPSVAGILIGTVGTGVCFLVNAASFAAVVYSLVTMDAAQLQPSTPTARAKGQLREGIAYVRRTPALLVPLLMMAMIGCLSYEFTVTLPIVAKSVLHGGASTYGFMTSAMGLGAVAGGLVTAGRGKTGTRPMAVMAAVFAVFIGLAAVAPTVPLELVALLFVGAASISFMAIGNSTLQLQAAPQMRGRVMALYAVAFLGSTPIGGPVVGAVAEYAGGRWGLGLGAAAAGAAACVGAVAVRHLAGADRVATPVPETAATAEAELETAEAG
ncbi:MAG TPA: MFS transporter [Mycobacteriales bacterium]